MKAKIDETGELWIEPETRIEGAALMEWARNYKMGNESSVLAFDLTYKKEAKDGNQR